MLKYLICTIHVVSNLCFFCVAESSHISRDYYLDCATAITYGSHNNIYVTGYNWNSVTLGDWLVVSLDTNGTANWVYSYNGPANWQDAASKIAYDDSQVYTCGYISCNSNDKDFAVISLAPTGDTCWTWWHGSDADLEDARAIACGLDGQVYTAGHVGGNGDDVFLVSLTAAGDTNWTYRYNGIGNSNDGANTIVCASDSLIYLAGYTTVSGTGQDILVMCLTYDGVVVWTNTYNGPGNSTDEAYSICYGENGDIYVAGYCTGNGTGKDMVILSLNATGDTNWTYTCGGLDNINDWVNSIVCGADGNIYAAGVSNMRFMVICLSSEGVYNWNYTLSGMSDAEAYAIDYGFDGNIYIGGHSGYTRGIVVSLASTGDTNWVNTYDLGVAEDKILALTLGAEGNIYAAGKSEPTYDNSDLLVISIAIDGTTNWIYQHDFTPGIGESTTGLHIATCCDWVKAYPCPCKDAVQFEFTVPCVSSSSSLELVDAAGRKRKVIWSDRQAVPKSYLYRVPAELAPGVYFLVLETGGVIYTARLLVTR